MAKEMRDSHDDIIRSAEELVAQIPDDFLSDCAVDTASASRNGFVREQQIKEFAALALEDGEITHGYVDVRVSKDDMIVKADFYPPKGGGSPVDKDALRDKLYGMKIVHGIDWDAIDDAADQCNRLLKPIPNIVIARGDRPVDGVPAQIVVEGHLLNKRSPGDPDNPGSVDYKAYTSYTLVRKGEVLARLVPAKEGKDGKTVKGELIPHRKGKIAVVKPHLNTAVSGDAIIAACDGRFELLSNLICVREVFEVHGDVNYKTGNISFPGDIIIHGRVNDGFTVESGGSIFCKETLDACYVRCEKDLDVSRGIIGRQKGTVKAGGTTSTKFIENCLLESRGSIFVSAGVLHSVLHTHDKLEMGVRSVIVGGKVYAQNGVVAYQIGTKMGIKTEICCGIDYEVQKKLEWIKEKSVALALKLNQIETAIKKHTTVNGALVDVKEKIKTAMHRLNEAAKSLVFQLDKSESAEVVAKGHVYPGVYIEICHASFVVTREYENVRFRLDREKGKIKVETYRPELFL